MNKIRGQRRNAGIIENNYLIDDEEFNKRMENFINNIGHLNGTIPSNLWVVFNKELNDVDKVYIIPTEDKPIKIAYEDKVILDEESYFKAIENLLNNIHRKE